MLYVVCLCIGYHVILPLRYTKVFFFLGFELNFWKLIFCKMINIKRIYELLLKKFYFWVQFKLINPWVLWNCQLYTFGFHMSSSSIRYVLILCVVVVIPIFEHFFIRKQIKRQFEAHIFEAPSIKLIGNPMLLNIRY